MFGFANSNRCLYRNGFYTFFCSFSLYSQTVQSCVFCLLIICCYMSQKVTDKSQSLFAATAASKYIFPEIIYLQRVIFLINISQKSKIHSVVGGVDRQYGMLSCKNEFSPLHAVSYHGFYKNSI